MRAMLPENEEERLAALREYSIMDTLPEPAYDDLTLLASQICEAPIAMLSLVDEERQWFKSRVGIEARQTPREHAFCAHAILEPDKTLVVRDALEDRRFADNPLVTSTPRIRFYAGAPLVAENGTGLGALCVVDSVPRTLTAEQERALEALSRQAMSLLTLRRTVSEIAGHALESRRQQEELERCRRQLESVNAELERQTLTDSLTGLMNRRAFETTLEAEIERALRYETPLTLALVDADRFKEYNDDFGHLEGDEALRQIASLLAANSRSIDAVARIGGEEFALVLPGTTPESALVHAERLREAVEGADWPRRAITVSIGIAGHGPEIGNRSQFMRRADQALYRAKNGGRNRCVA